MPRRFLLLFAILPAMHGDASGQTAPVADAGTDVAVECAGPRGTPVQLDGSASRDPDGHALSFAWTSPSFRLGTSLTDAAPLVALPLGTHVITLEVADGADGVDTDEVVVAVRDTIPPGLRTGGKPLALWPPNHSLHAVDLRRFVLGASDSCDGELDRDAARFGQVTSDEPDDGTGDGDTAVDIRIAEECRQLEVRSERAGDGDGRVYEAEILIEDASGNLGSAVATVAAVASAPRRRAIDSGDEYAVTSSCEPDGPGLCPLLPDPSCDAVLPRGRASVLIYAHARSDRFDGLRFQMLGIDSDAADFGDPRGETDYQLCVYGRTTDSAAPFGLLMNPRAPSGGAWAAGRDSFVYRARYGEDDGLNLIALRALSGGRGEISVIGSGVDVDVPELPLDQAAGVELQLQNRDGRCWGAKFPDALRSTAVLHQAVED